MDALEKITQDMTARIEELRGELAPKQAELSRLEAALRALEAPAAKRRGRPKKAA